jgi:hypothetical protein
VQRAQRVIGTQRVLRVPQASSKPGRAVPFWVRPDYTSMAELFSKLGVVEQPGLGPAGLPPLLPLLACAPPPQSQAAFMDHCLGNRQSCPGAGGLCISTKVPSSPNELTLALFLSLGVLGLLVTHISQGRSSAPCQVRLSHHPRQALGRREDLRFGMSTPALLAEPQPSCMREEPNSAPPAYPRAGSLPPGRDGASCLPKRHGLYQLRRGFQRCKFSLCLLRVFTPLLEFGRWIQRLSEPFHKLSQSEVFLKTA